MNKQNKQTGGLTEGVVDADASCRVRTSGQPAPSLLGQILRCLCTSGFAGRDKAREPSQAASAPWYCREQQQKLFRP